MFLLFLASFAKDLSKKTDMKISTETHSAITTSTMHIRGLKLLPVAQPRCESCILAHDVLGNAYMSRRLTHGAVVVHMGPSENCAAARESYTIKKFVGEQQERLFAHNSSTRLSNMCLKRITASSVQH